MNAMNKTTALLASWAIAFGLFVDCSHVSANEPIEVAVFEGNGVGPSVEQLIEALQMEYDRKIVIRRITADAIRAGELSTVDVVVHPGGSGSRQGKALGDEGREAVRSFVRDGGGYLGVCAGAYLGTNDYTWSLNLIDAKSVDRAHWRRGTGTVTTKLAPAATRLFNHDGEDVQLFFGQGPLLGRREWDNANVPDYQSLAIYETEVAENGAPKGIMKGTSAIVRGRYGSGRVFIFSAHPEMTEGREHLIPRSVDWLAPVNDEHAIENSRVTEVVRQYVPVDSSGGVAVLVTRDGQVLHRKAYGFVKGEHLTTSSRLSLASVTKQFAAVCAAQLVEVGKLDIAQNVSHYLPNVKLPVVGRELRVQDLLWHTSGLPNFINKKEQAAMAEFKKQRGLNYLTNATHADWLTTMPMKRAPGEIYEYTNSGYVLLTRIIEVLTDESFHEYQQRQIFDALGMSETTDSSRFNGSGNMRTTLLDYEKWDRALWEHDPRLLSPEGYAMLFTPGVLDNGERVDYGFGWELDFENEQLISARHGGAGSGTTAARNMVLRHFDDRTTVAIFAQEHPLLTRSRRDQFADSVYQTLIK